MDIIEKNISNLIKTQFPAFYQEEGPVFIQFVTEYYKWLESKSLARDAYFCERKSTIAIQSESASVVGQGTIFTEQYGPGEKIAICKGPNTNDYELFTVDTVANNIFLTLTSDKLPRFSLPSTRHGTVSDKANALYYARQFLEIKDIDETLEEFIVFFKEKYLTGIQFETQTDIRRFVKNSLDLYRSKGTERSVDLLFKIVFGVPAEVYYPASDLLKFSDGQWYQPRYLELSLHDELHRFVNRQITGLNSGATAFVESVVRKKIKSKFVDVLYISAINGTFRTGEKVNTFDKVIDNDEAPVITGSMSELVLDILGTGENFKKGDVVDIVGTFGRNGKARVLDTLDTTGFIQFNFEEGGYGYSSNAKVLVSDKILLISNVGVSNTNITQEYFSLFDQLIQPYAYLNFENANGVIANGQTIFTYHANNTVKGQGTVLNAQYQSATNGILTVAVLTGNLDSSGIYTPSNTVGANLSVSNGYFDMTATANVIGTTTEQYLKLSNITGTFLKDEEVFQVDTFGDKNANGKILDVRDIISTNAVVRVTNSQGIFDKGVRIRGSVSNASGNVQIIDIPVGIINVNGVLNDDPGNYVHFKFSKSNGTITSISTGTNASGNISPVLLYPETIVTSFDEIEPWVTANVPLNALEWDIFPPIEEGPPPVYANLALSSSIPIVIAELLANTTVTIGKVSGLVSINPGEGYATTPVVKIYEPKVYKSKIPDTLKITITDQNSPFVVGELVTQRSSNARGIIATGSSNAALYVKNLRFYENNYFQVSNSDSNTRIVGANTAAYANVTLVETAELFDYLGFNATASAQLRSSNGGITKTVIIDSGFGYNDGDVVTLQKDDGIAGDGTAIVKTLTAGIGSGYYRRNGGFLSSDKKLFDAEYWQEYSYEVRSSVTLNKYYDMLRQILHVSGTKMFGAFVYNSINTVDTDVQIQIDTSP